MNDCTELVLIRGSTMNTNLCLENIIIKHVMFAPFVNPHFLFMQDIARPHIVRIVMEYLNALDIPVVDWSANTPDLNFIEHLLRVITC